MKISFLLSVLTAALLGACVSGGHETLIVTAPKTHLAVGETVNLTAMLPAHPVLDSLGRSYMQEYMWDVRKPHSGFRLGMFNGVLTALHPDTATVCARLWFFYKPAPDRTKTNMLYTSVGDGCIRVSSSPAK